MPQPLLPNPIALKKRTSSASDLVKRHTRLSGAIYTLVLLMLQVLLLPVTANAQGCPSISTLPCSSVEVALPYNLTFGGNVDGTMADKNGAGTGFTMVADYSGTRLAADGAVVNPSVPGHVPSKLTIGNGKLQVVTNKGIAWVGNDNQLNAMGVGVRTNQNLQIETTLENPFSGTQSQQAGLWFGLSDKTFVKLVVVDNKIEMRREVNNVSSTTSGTSNPDQRATAAISGLSSRVVRLRLVVNANAGTVEGFYSFDGATYTNVGANYSTRTLSIAGTGLVNASAYAGIFATHRNASSAVTYTFDGFSVKSLTPPAEPTTALIKNVTATTSSPYALSKLTVGTLTYTDRTSKVTSVPDQYKDADFIRTPNADKFNTSTSLLKFELTQPATVYIAYDPRATVLPAWLSTWQKTSDRIGIEDSKISYLEVYRKAFDAGQVQIGANLASPGKGPQTNYMVLAKVAGNQPPVANAGPDKNVSLPTNTVTLNGEGTDSDGTIESYTWSQVSGPNTATFSSKTVQAPVVSNLVSGKYIFSLVVKDNSTASSAPDEVAVNVTAPSASACSPISTLACSQLQVQLPYTLSFSSNVENTLGDKNGTGTGFTMVADYSGSRLAEDGAVSNPQVPGYEPSRITLSAGKLQLATNKGISWLTNNNQINALGVGVTTNGIIQVETSLVNPYAGTAGQQAGVWLGLDDKTYVKLVVTGGKVELRREVKDASSSASAATNPDQRITSTIAGLNANTVYLRLVLDENAGTVEGFYSLDGNMFSNVGATYSTRTLSIAGTGLAGASAYAGILATHRNGTSSVTYSFDDFSVTSGVSAEELRPYVTVVRPENGKTGVALDQSISVDLQYPSGKSIDGSTVNPGTVKLYTIINGSKAEVFGTAVNTTAAGDAITLTATLEPTSTYEFEISDRVKDLNGYRMIPFTSRFTTAQAPVGTPNGFEGVSFTEVKLIDSSLGHYGITTLVIGPDRRLYAATSGGIIERWDIKADGTLENRVTMAPFGNTPRLLIGLRFDPASTSSNLILWASHSSGEFYSVPEWSSKVSRINVSNPNDVKVQDVLVNLPRSFKDHSVNSIDFGPDGALYFAMGSNTAMGAADAAWGQRSEKLLNAAVLRLDVSSVLNGTLPLDVKTEEGGNYNPYAANAPLTLYATGIRNAYDLVWHSNGQLYVPTNGSAAGGNIPGLQNGAKWSNGQTYTGPTIEAINDARDTQNDYLFRVEKGGYYGHPNTLRNEYIMLGGNPTSGIDPGEVVWSENGIVKGYPVGTPAEPNFRGWSYDFGTNISPNGVIEYKSNAFGGKLKGKLFVCRFSGGDDLIVMEPGGTSKDIVRATEGIRIPGLRRPFSNPLDIIEDVETGNLYLTEYTEGNGPGVPSIVLLRADVPATAQSQQQLDVVESLPEKVQAADKLVIYPNPAEGEKLFVTLNGFEANEEVELSIVDATGTQIYSKTVKADSKGASNAEVNFNQQVRAGLYIVRAKSASAIETKKLIVK
ncbi:PKD domain-containing protein [Pontibacter arcticus]|uniref:PKD/Chitinase domain-containing protein n=1 Tax=Pontibacter arcticus TaxID=2080288 RepID=A0A364RDQ5_9BACT|nr:T9SS type A sorting domain-containing protein [Pontibacter arcticus]RAU82422.1 hypothetical protein DP923_11600 [Pontibacter arcticus]